MKVLGIEIIVFMFLLVGIYLINAEDVVLQGNLLNDSLIKKIEELSLLRPTQPAAPQLSQLAHAKKMMHDQIIQRIEALLESGGANPNATDKQGIPALRLAIRANDLFAVQMLIKSGAKVDLMAPDGNAALHSAVKNADQAIVEALLNAQANQNIQNLYGETPLTLAVMYRRLPGLNLLLSRYADPKIKNNAGKTAKEIAKKLGYSEIASVLAD